MNNKVFIMLVVFIVGVLCLDMSLKILPVNFKGKHISLLGQKFLHHPNKLCI